MTLPQQEAPDASASRAEAAAASSGLLRRGSPASERGEPTLASQRLYVHTTSSDAASAEVTACAPCSAPPLHLPVSMHTP